MQYIENLSNTFLNASIPKEIAQYDEEKISSIFQQVHSYYSDPSAKLTFSQKCHFNRLIEALPLENLSVETLDLASKICSLLKLNERSTKSLVDCLLAKGNQSETPLQPSIAKESEQNIHSSMTPNRSSAWQNLDDKLIAAKINRLNGFRQIHEKVKANASSLSWLSLFAYCRKLHTENSFKPHLHGEMAAQFIDQQICRLKEIGIPPCYEEVVVAQMFGATAVILNQAPVLETFLFDFFPDNLSCLDDQEIYMISIGVQNVSDPVSFAEKIAVSIGQPIHELSRRKAVALLGACSKGREFQLFESLAQQCQKHIWQMNGCELRAVIEAVSNFSQENKGTCSPYETLIADCMEICCYLEIEPKVQASICNHLAKCNYKATAWMEKMLTRIEKKAFDPWDEVTVLYSFARLGVTNSSIQFCLARLIHYFKETMRDQKRELDCLYLPDLMRLAWAASFHFGSNYPELTAPLIKAVLQKNLKQIDKQMIRTVIDVTNYPRQGIDPEILDAKEILVGTSYTQAKIGGLLKEKLTPLGILIEEEVFIGCFPVDFLFPNVMIDNRPIVLEVDGPCHFTKPDDTYNGSSQIKSYYIEKFGYHLIRMKISGTQPLLRQKVDAFIEQIIAHASKSI